MENENVITPAEVDREIVAASTAETERPKALPHPPRLGALIGGFWEQAVSLHQKSLVIILLLLTWELAPRLELIDSVFFPPATSVLKSLWELIRSGLLLKHTLVSFNRALIGFALATAVAIPFGFLVGWFKSFERFVDPALQTFRQLPTLALFPVFILIFGIGEVSKVAIIAKASFWPIFLNMVTGVSHVDPLIVKSARSMGVKPFGIFRWVVLPAAIPSMFSGLRLSGTTALLMLVAAEMLGANAGLGFLIFNSESRFEIDTMYAAILAMTILGMAVNYGLLALQRRMSRWKEEVVQH